MQGLLGQQPAHTALEDFDKTPFLKPHGIDHRLIFQIAMTVLTVTVVTAMAGLSRSEKTDLERLLEQLAKNLEMVSCKVQRRPPMVSRHTFPESQVGTRSGGVCAVPPEATTGDDNPGGESSSPEPEGAD
jgi:hypothetical protein